MRGSSVCKAFLDGLTNEEMLITETVPKIRPHALSYVTLFLNEP